MAAAGALSPCGLQNSNIIADGSFSASTSSNANTQAANSRLHFQGPAPKSFAWCAATSDANQYVQVDFQTPRWIGGVAIQGRGDAAHWVTTFKISHSLDAANFTVLADTFPGALDQNTVVTHTFVNAFQARFVRLMPLTWNGAVAARWELFNAKFTNPPWFTMPNGWTDNILQNYRNKYENFAPPAGIPCFNIITVGGVGAGKSSLHNTLQHARTGHNFEVATAGSAAGASLTRLVSRIGFDAEAALEGRNCRLYLWDMPGFDGAILPYINGELGIALRGNLRSGYDLMNGIRDNHELYNRNPTIFDRMHCMLLLMNCMSLDVPSYVAKCSDFVRNARDTGTPLLIVLTQVDKLEPEILNSPAKMYASVEVKHSIAALAERLGVEQRQVIPLLNFHSSFIGNQLECDINAYHLLEEAVQQCRGYFFRPENAAEARRQLDAQRQQQQPQQQQQQQPQPQPQPQC